MKRLLKKYYYLYYKIYRSIEYTSRALGGEFWTDVKALLVITILQSFVIISFVGYYSIFVDRYFNLERNEFIGINILIMIANTKLFLHTEEWKKYFIEFDNLSKDENKKGTYIIIGIIFFIIANFIYMLYLKNQIDWSMYR